MEILGVILVVFVISLVISTFWVRGIDKNLDLNSDNCGWLE